MEGGLWFGSAGMRSRPLYASSGMRQKRASDVSDGFFSFIWQGGEGRGGEGRWGEGRGGSMQFGKSHSLSPVYPAKSPPWPRPPPPQ